MWHSQCPASWPVWARHWASSKGSLTKKLVALNQGFEVQPVVQSTTCIQNGPNLPPQCAKAGMMRQRLVRLHVGGQAVVFAQTLLTMDGPVNDWRFWNGLGKRSLGSMLFRDPRVKRGPLFFAKLPAWQPWVMALIGEGVDGMATTPHRNARVWYARCARFEHAKGQTPLWVMEVFLPTLKNFV